MSRIEPEMPGRHDVARDRENGGYRCIVCGKRWSDADTSHVNAWEALMKNDACLGAPERKIGKAAELALGYQTNPPLVGEFQETDVSLEPGGMNYALRKGETKEDVIARAAAEVAKYSDEHDELDADVPDYSYTDDDVRKALQVLRSNGLVTVARAIADRHIEMNEWLHKRGMPSPSEYVEYKETRGPDFGKPYHTEQLVGVPVRLLNELVKALGL